MSTVKIITYCIKATGKEPFLEWLEEQDLKTQSIVYTRLDRVALGNFGDCKRINNGDGIWELRIDYGSGYRIYFGKQGNSVVVLLIGGDKGSQSRDITKAKHYWATFKK